MMVDKPKVIGSLGFLNRSEADAACHIEKTLNRNPDNALELVDSFLVAGQRRQSLTTEVSERSVVAQKVVERQAVDFLAGHGSFYAFSLRHC